MAHSLRKINLFSLFNLPAAYFTGVRTTFMDSTRCEVVVKHRWINQNPFGSMFWAVQGMAAEMTTGLLLMTKIKKSKKSIAMLVAHNNADFYKKARGKITFSCEQGNSIDVAIEKAIATTEGQKLTLHAVGHDEDGDKVSSFNFEWSIKLRS